MPDHFHVTVISRRKRAFTERILGCEMTETLFIRYITDWEMENPFSLVALLLEGAYEPHL
jgi:hypothetical protein